MYVLNNYYEINYKYNNLTLIFMIDLLNNMPQLPVPYRYIPPIHNTT